MAEKHFAVLHNESAGANAKRLLSPILTSVMNHDGRATFRGLTNRTVAWDA
jgi:hypothetical protein